MLHLHKTADWHKTVIKVAHKNDFFLVVLVSKSKLWIFHYAPQMNWIPQSLVSYEYCTILICYIHIQQQTDGHLPHISALIFFVFNEYCNTNLFFDHDQHSLQGNEIPNNQKPIRPHISRNCIYMYRLYHDVEIGIEFTRARAKDPMIV